MGETTAAIDAMAKKRRGAIVKLDTAAYFSGYSVSALHAMIAAGLPIAKGGGGPGKPIEIDCAVLIDWLVRRERERIVNELSGITLAQFQAAGLLLCSSRPEIWNGALSPTADGQGKEGDGQRAGKTGESGIPSIGGQTKEDGGKHGQVSSGDGTPGAGIENENTIGSILNWKMRQGMARARTLELELAKAEGALVEIGTVEIVFTQIVSTARARLLALPSRTAPQCAVEGDVAKVRRIIEESVREILEELASVKPAELMEQGEFDEGITMMEAKE
jgi:phage terminase Nu1 subunit (DNA packaging protein)